MPTTARTLLNNAPLNGLPAQDLRYRLLDHLDIPIDQTPPATAHTHPTIRNKKPDAHQLSPTPTPTPPR